MCCVVLVQYEGVQMLHQVISSLVAVTCRGTKEGEGTQLGGRQCCTGQSPAWPPLPQNTYHSPVSHQPGSHFCRTPSAGASAAFVVWEFDQGWASTLCQLAGAMHRVQRRHITHCASLKGIAPVQWTVLLGKQWVCVCVHNRFC